MLSVQHEKKLIKQQQSNKNKKKSPNKKPVKVVYIANPMKVKTSASEFSALVQELTGQDADVPEASKFEEVSGTNSAYEGHDAPVAISGEQNVASRCEYYQEGYNNIGTFHGFDNVEMNPQMLDNNFPGFECPKLWYES